MQENLNQTEKKNEMEKGNESQKNQGLFNKIWNSKTFAKAAIHFEHIMQWITAPIAFVIMCVMFSDGHIYIGLLALLWCVGAIWVIIERHRRRKKFYEEHSICPNCGKHSFKMRFCSNCGSAMPVLKLEDSDGAEENTGKNLAKKKKEFVWSIVIIVGLILFTVVGGWDMVFGSPISRVQEMTFGEMEESIGILVDERMRGAEWSKEKIDSDSCHVYVEGYMRDLHEDVRITFFYEEFDDYCEASIISVELMDSEELYTDIWSIGMFLALLQEE